jgi:hypothetical protein
MAATTSGAIKAFVEGLGLSLPAFRDGPRPGQAPPYAVVTEGQSIGLAPTGNGDYGDPTADVQITEVVTVDIVQHARVKTGAQTARNVERYGLVETVAHRLHCCTLPAHPARITAVRVQGIDRLPITDNIARSTIQLAITRSLLTSEVTPV